MKKLAWLVIMMALIEGGWLAYDGARALILGDYVTPSSGEYAGQLGPWTNLVTAIGIEPRSTLMKSIHLGLGLAFLTAIYRYARGWRGGWRNMLACAILGLWYLPFGTLLSLGQIGLLLSPGLRRARDGGAAPASPDSPS